ncbi:hypothetical protein Scep_024747 [Stephania cephalantha]|uniref:Uncharacterized protein n=1 Tax=Stephania cephalantha TaxID=152367 RepID=A0AAP0F018_9MAGN
MSTRTPTHRLARMPFILRYVHLQVTFDIGVAYREGLDKASLFFFGLTLTVSTLTKPNTQLTVSTLASPSTVSTHGLNSRLSLNSPLPPPSQLTISTLASPSTVDLSSRLSLHRLNSRSQLSPSRARQSPPSGYASPLLPSLDPSLSLSLLARSPPPSGSGSRSLSLALALALAGRHHLDLALALAVSCSSVATISDRLSLLRLSSSRAIARRHRAPSVRPRPHLTDRASPSEPALVVSRTASRASATLAGDCRHPSPVRHSSAHSSLCSQNRTKREPDLRGYEDRGGGFAGEGGAGGENWWGLTWTTLD